MLNPLFYVVDSIINFRMKKCFSFLSITLILLCVVVTFVACGGDDDNGEDDNKTQPESIAGGSSKNQVPWGYYAAVYEWDKTYYGNVDASFCKNFEDAIAADDTYMIETGIFQDPSITHGHLGYYIYVENGVSYLVDLWSCASKVRGDVNTEYNSTYDTRTFTDRKGNKITVYFNITGIDPHSFKRLDDVTNVSYKNGYLTLGNSQYKYKRLSFTEHLPWLDEWCHSCVYKLQQ